MTSHVDILVTPDLPPPTFVMSNDVLCSFLESRRLASRFVTLSLNKIFFDKILIDTGTCQFSSEFF